MNSKTKDKRKQGFARLVEIAGTKKWWLFLSMFLAVLATAVQFIPIVAVYLVIQELALHAADISALDSALLYRLGFISLGSVALYGALLYASLMISHVSAFTILYEIRVQIAEKLSRVSMGFFSKKASGQLKKVMSEDVEQIELFVAHHIPDITSAVVFPLAMIVFLFIVDWRLAIAALVPFPLTFGVMIRMMYGPDTKEAYQNYHNALENMNAAVVEYVRGMPVVKVFGSAMDSFQRLNGAVEDHRSRSKNMAKDYSRTYPAFLTAASSSLMFIIPAVVLVLKFTPIGTQFVPTALLFMIVGGGFFFPLLKLLFMSGFLNQINVGVQRIDEILYMDEMEEAGADKKPSGSLVEFDRVGFAYNETPVLQDLSFSAAPGSVTALVGPSGAGKTTVGLLAVRFWDIDSGSIRIGGADIREMKSEVLMNHVSFVFQDGFLFFDTIEENIRMGNKIASHKELVAAAEAACCHDFIEALPEGYQTLVGEGGTYLSGGEVQRISIARSILKDAPVVILDEATAYADPEGEGKILEGLSRLMKNKTVLVIAHRLSTISNADQILVIDEGRLTESGTHQELITASGLYADMWATYSRAREWKIAAKNKKEGVKT